MAEKITDEKLRGIINSEINNAIGFMGSNLTSQRKKSMEYYMGEKLGTEIDGRSQVVSTDVADTIETILPNSYVIVSQPNHEGGITPWFEKLVSHCKKVKTQIFLDCTFFGTTLDKINVYDEVFDCVSFSLSKSFMLGGFRAGIVFGNNLSKTLTIPIDYWYNYSYYNSCAVQLAKIIMNNFSATYITEVAKPIQEKYCMHAGLEPCDVWMMGINEQGERINLVDKLQPLIQNELDKNGTV